MQKKIIIIIALLLVVLSLGAAYKTFLAPKGVEGVKAVSIQIVIENREIDETFTFDTEHEFLYDLLKENESALGASFKNFEFGTMITGMKDYVADENSEYFHISINSEDALSGPQEIPLQDGDHYKFELIRWK